MAPANLANLLHQFLDRAELAIFAMAVLGLVAVPLVLLLGEYTKPRPSR